MEIITVKAYAKINLGLEILNKRQDGYHNINSAMTRISHADSIYLRKNKEIIVNSSPELNIPCEHNLVYKAALLLKRKFDINEGVEINIEKNIPMGAGLGGGSSDAASTILGLMKLWSLDMRGITSATLSELAKELGADVPFFLKKGNAIASGKGDELEYFDFGLHYYVLIVMAEISISTKWAYENLNETHFAKEKTALKTVLEIAKTNKSILKEKVFNNFELLIFDHFPEIRIIKEELYRNEAFFALMSGSGASVYGLFDTREEALAASLKFSNYKCFVCELI
ncbi:MAG: 4-(cytidine 5'-diphospho)-2-C-methyl-D-erythritol kinase [Bacteroidetes bacterium]|nr:MAG: 4-(cytidine 5'-diphospho)-2-C-methyl-D-erythritol kinase [Bacteroidota bacterium]